MLPDMDGFEPWALRQDDRFDNLPVLVLVQG
jgi:hypothetical protein